MDPNNKKAWSGTHYYILQALKKHCGEVITLGPLPNKWTRYVRLFNRISMALFKKQVNVNHIKIVSKEFARVLRNKIKKHDLDLLFVPSGGSKIAYLETDLPIYSTNDATTKLLIDNFHGFNNLFEFSKKRCLEIDKRAMDKSRKVIFSSQCAHDCAMKNYSIPEKKMVVIPFGANVTPSLVWEEIEKRRVQAYKEVCKLLFVGVEWERKGGEIAFNTMKELNDRGVEAELTVIGCTPPERFKHPNLNVVGFLDKNNDEDAEKLDEYYLQASFFLFPTREESFGIVLCEASCYGLPAITTDTGGVPTIVRNGVNGFTLDLSADHTDFADVIGKMWRDEPQRLAMCRQARMEFENRLNWDAWGKQVARLIDESMLRN